MVLIPAGQFLMGSTEAETNREKVPARMAAREYPQHQVVIPHPFAMGRTEVTRAEFAAFVADTGTTIQANCLFWGNNKWERAPERDWRNPGFAQTDDDPVVCVDWSDAQKYAAWLSQRSGHTYRIPSEAEWEYAARAGSATARYWGDDTAIACAYGNVADDAMKAHFNDWPALSCNDGFVFTAPVGSFKPNAFGLYDMMGNVWEWTGDCIHDTYDGAPGTSAAWHDTPGCDPVMRGGTWDGSLFLLRSAARVTFPQTQRMYRLGFRVVRDVKADATDAVTRRN